MMIFRDLPIPSPAVRTHSEQLLAVIKQTIQQQGDLLSFAHFMEVALYHPEFGYYNSPSFALGQRGDFITAPELSPLFAQCMAQQCQRVLASCQPKQILEFGAGTGRFAKDLLFALASLHCLPDRYYILERSMTLRQKQYDLFRTACPQWIDRFTWLDTDPTHFTGVIIANEVLDALPVHCFRIEEHGIKEYGVTWDQNRLIRLPCTPFSPGLMDTVRSLQTLYDLRSGYESEVNLQLPTFIKRMAQMLTQGLIMLADYGYGQRQYYHPARCQGTLTCFYQHHRHHDPFFLPGAQDITAHVDFTRVAEIAAEQGCTLAGYTTQAAFLLACGLPQLATAAEQHLTPIETVQWRQAIKRLTLPTEMGETIKIMGLTKRIDLPLLGWTLQDRRRDL
jgi:SAM-dependent MidA family methyltransferase